MRRREFIVGAGWLALGGMSHTTFAQSRGPQLGSGGKPRRIGFIAGGDAGGAAIFRGFTVGMRELGWHEGADYIVEWRYAEGRYERFAEFATELLGLGVEVFVLATGAATPALRRATTTVPIVLGYSTDPVGNGFVQSLARPGGNVTGLAGSADDTAPKQLELLAAIVPGLKRAALFVNPNTPMTNHVKGAQTAAAALGIVLQVESVTAADQVEPVFRRLAAAGTQAVFTAPDGMFFGQRKRFADLALSHRLPSMFPHREYAMAGGLMSYGEDLREFYRRAAIYVDKVLKGARPEDLPVEQPTRFHLVVNRKTADALGLDIPPHVLVFANEVLE